MGLPFLAQLAIGAGVTAGGAVLANKAKPDIPDPVKPRDFTRRARSFYDGVVAEGDPMRERRDRTAVNRLLTNSAEQMEGPTGASTLAIRKEGVDDLNKNVSRYLQESDRMEQERQFGAEEQLYKLEADRQRDLDEYEQQVAGKEASEEIAAANFKAGIFRAGTGLLSSAFEGLSLENGDPGNEVGNFDFSPPGGTGLEYESRVGYGNQNPANLFEEGLFGSSELRPSGGEYAPDVGQVSRRSPLNDMMWGVGNNQTYPLFN